MVVGLLDTATPPALSRELAAGIPGAKLVELPHCGHSPHIQDPDGFWQAIKPFLGAGGLIMDSHRPADWKPRVEDAALLTGRGRFTDDVHAPNEAIACFVRSPHALATLRSIDTAAARALPGVLGVFTHEELAAFGAEDDLAPRPGPRPRSCRRGRRWPKDRWCMSASRS